jgi:hypothetical protein
MIAFASRGVNTDPKLSCLFRYPASGIAFFGVISVHPD